MSSSGKRHRLQLILDEFPALGRLDFFESALAFMAGYGSKGFLIAQSLHQIECAYGLNNAILDNCLCASTLRPTTSAPLSGLATRSALRPIEPHRHRRGQHLEQAKFEGRVPGDDYEGYVDARVRRLKALRQAGFVERIDVDQWRIPR